MKIYKYIGASTLDKVFANENSVGFKCSFPRDFNDPYELFLALDNYDDQNVVSYFNELLTSVVQMPTTCFSKRPDVIPMWAHYANTSSGVVVGIDEDLVSNAISSARFDDVKYKEEPHIIKASDVNYAIATRKPRHTFFVQRSAMDNAYFSKNSCWSYEKERRLIVSEDDLVDVNSNLILNISNECVTSVIAGCNASDETVELCHQYCLERDLEYYQINIGKSSIVPFFLNSDGETFVFKDGEFEAAKNYCSCCGEPVAEDCDGECHWCAMTEMDKENAALNNPLRILARHGLGEAYGVKAVKK